MTELKGSETSTATKESSLEELNASWQTFWACGHPRTSSDPVLKPRPSSHTNSGSYMQISYTCCTGVWPRCNTPAAHGLTCDRTTIPGWSQSGLGTATQPADGKRTLSAYRTSVWWSQSDLHCSAGNLQQVWTRWGFSGCDLGSH